MRHSSWYDSGHTSSYNQDTIISISKGDSCIRLWSRQVQLGWVWILEVLMSSYDRVSSWIKKLVICGSAGVEQQGVMAAPIRKYSSVLTGVSMEWADF